jgi:peptidoglycan hydrolase-like protein with peptidoglycan-binding domain
MRSGSATLLVAACLSGPALAQQAPSLLYTQPLAPAAVAAVQDKLRQAGAYTGRADGVWGPDSQAALERFQTTHGLVASTQLNPATAATLGIPLADQISLPIRSCGRSADSAALRAAFAAASGSRGAGFTVGWATGLFLYWATRLSGQGVWALNA